MCVSAIKTKYKTNTGESIAVPCGACYECRRSRIEGWAVRIEKEADVSTSAFFITLTYNDDNLPLSGNDWATLYKYDLQNFFKRLRKRSKNKIKYYAVGEYGEQTFRPHYHILIFNANVHDIEKSWKIGNIHIGTLEKASIRYVLNYMEKERWKPHPDDDREPMKAYMSKGLGKAYINERTLKWHRDDVLNRAYYPLPDGRKTSLPRYYKEKLYTKEERKKQAESYQNKEIEATKRMSPKDVEKYYLQKTQNKQVKHRKFERKKNQKTENITLYENLD